MSYLKFMLSFFIKGLFTHPDEYNINSSRFNVVKVLFVVAFLFFFLMTFFLSFKFFALGKRHIDLTEAHRALNVEHKILHDRIAENTSCLKNQYLVPSDVLNLPQFYKSPIAVPPKEPRTNINEQQSEFYKRFPFGKPTDK